MIPERNMKSLSATGLRVILMLFLYVLVAIAVIFTPPPAKAQEKPKFVPDVTLSNKHYILRCENKTKGACEQILKIIEGHEETRKQRREERIREQLEEHEREKSSLNRI